MGADPQILDYLYSLRNHGSNYGIDRMRGLIAAVGEPHKNFPVIHVAGTNGKGSVCAMLESLYRSNGYKTGLFTSPHLVHLGERIQVDRTPLNEEALLKQAEALRVIATALGNRNPELSPSFFEFVAALALQHFATSEVDIACIETGLGGRLDATNIVDPELSIITTISLDHTELLGDSIEVIAVEKGGIIKPGKPVLLGNVVPTAETILRALAEERGSPVYHVAERFPDPKQRPTPNLAGDCQRWNAATAIYATELLAERFPIQSTASLQQIDWPGRWQTIELADKTLILDATHNAEGCQQLIENLEQLPSPPIIVAGTLGEERGRSLMQTVAPYAHELYLVAPQQERAVSPKFLRGCLPKDLHYPIREAQLPELFPAPQQCAIGDHGATIVATGSLYLIGEILERLGYGSTTRLGHLQDKI